MKTRYFSLLLLCAIGIVFASCQHEEDDIFNKRAADRLNEASDLYSARLKASPNGWAMQYYPTYQDEYPYGNGYLILMVFNDNNSVDVAMNNEFTRNTYKVATSLWEVITDNGPVLSFNSYNECMHAFSDPEDIPWTGTVDEPNSETGEGCGGDYEFIIVDAPEDASYLMLKGKKRGTYNLLTPVEVGVEFSSYLEDVQAFHAHMFPANYPSYNVIHYGDDLYKMEGADDGLPNIYPYDGDAITDESFNPFLITKRGDQYYLRFRDAKTSADGASVQDYCYNVEQDRFISVENENYYIEGSSAFQFFTSVIEGGIRRWEWYPESDMSPEYKTYFDNIVSEFAEVDYTTSYNYAPKSLQWRVNGEDLLFRIEYTYQQKTGKKTATADYIFTMQKEDNSVVFKFKEDANQISTNLKGNIPSIQSMINLLEGKWMLNGGETNFDLRTIKLKSESNPNIWYNVSLI